MRKIAVANQKGGVGKTTTTICVAQELRNRGYKVCVLDTDAQCNTTHFYGAKTEGENTVMDILCGDVNIICVRCAYKIHIASPKEKNLYFSSTAVL